MESSVDLQLIKFNPQTLKDRIQNCSKNNIQNEIIFDPPTLKNRIEEIKIDFVDKISNRIEVRLDPSTLKERIQNIN